MRKLVADMAVMDMDPTKRMEQDVGMPKNLLPQKKEDLFDHASTLLMAPTEQPTQNDDHMQGGTASKKKWRIPDDWRCQT